MKIKYNKLVMLLPFIILLIIGCNNKKSMADLAYQIDCDKTCNDKADNALADFENCTSPYKERLRVALNVCNQVPPANKVECMTRAIDNYIADSEKCYKEYKEKLAEVKKCRTGCINRGLIKVN